jgi:segregation and condensation protein B
VSETEEREPATPPEEVAAAMETEAAPAAAVRRPSAPSEHLRAIVEALVFVSDHPVTPKEIARSLRSDVGAVREALAALVEESAGRGVELVEVAGGYQLRTNPEHASWVQHWLQARPVRLTRAQLETLAIVAYRQPVTRADVENVRGVDCGGVLKLLLERSLVKILGKKDEPGRPLLYGTTAAFLELFGMKSLRDLPTLREFAELSEEHRALVEAAHGPGAVTSIEEEMARAEAEAEGEDRGEVEEEL